MGIIATPYVASLGKYRKTIKFKFMYTTLEAIAVNLFVQFQL
jgi:hypothetical protein